MDLITQKKLRDIAYQKARESIPQVIEVLREEYHKPLGERVKLSHHLLRDKLGLSNPVAWKALAMVAKERVMCVQFPAGPIYWDNDLIKMSELIDRNLCVSRYKTKGRK